MRLPNTRRTCPLCNRLLTTKNTLSTLTNTSSTIATLYSSSRTYLLAALAVMATTMDNKQLQDAGKQIVKAADGGDPSSTILSLLQPLQKAAMTEDLLRSSKIGVAVNKIRQNKDPKVASLAGQLINKWKADVAAAKKGASKTGSPAPAAKAQAAAAVNGRASTSSPAPGQKMDGVKKEADAGKRKSKIAPEKRNSKVDEVDTKVTGNQTRDGCIELIYNGLSFMSEEAPEDILNVARSVELAAYEDHGQDTTQAYKVKMRSLFQNLKMKNNEDLRKGVFNGDISPKKFVMMTSDQLKSAERRAEDAALEKENMSKAMTAQEEKAISTTYVTHPASHLLFSAVSRERSGLIHLPSISATWGQAWVVCEVFFAFVHITPSPRYRDSFRCTLADVRKTA